MLLECVNELNESDILSEDLLYELFEIESAFDREQTLQQVQKRAEQLKVKTAFNKLYKAFNQDHKKELAIQDMPSYITQFNDRPPLRSGVWRADMNGIWTLSDKGRLYACSHPIYTKSILNNMETKTCKVELEFWVRNKWSSIKVDRKVIASRQSIIALASHGIRVTSENAGALVQYLSDIEALNEDNIGEQNSTSRLGWVGDGLFLPYEANVVFDNENNVGTLYNSIVRSGSYDKWLDCVKAERKNKRKELLIFLAASFASVLVEPLGVLPFIVDMWGGTGKGKTVTLMIATSIWANPNEGEYITDAKTTPTAMEIRLDVLNSLPLTIDDLAQIKNKVEDFSQLIYLLCSGSGKGRATKEAGLRQTYSWKNCILTTTEHSMTSETMQGGAINRVIELECENKDIYKRPTDVADIIRKNYGFAGFNFVQAIKDMPEKELTEIQKKYYDMLNQMAKDLGDEKEQKQIIPMSIILTADKLAERFIFQDGIRLDPEMCFKLLKSKNDISEGVRAYNFLMDTIGSNSYRFEEPSDSETPERFERWGRYLDDERVAIIGKYFDKIIADAGSQTRAFLSWAKTVDIIELDSTGKSKKIVSYGGQKLRSVVIKRNWNTEFEDIDEDLPFD